MRNALLLLVMLTSQAPAFAQIPTEKQIQTIDKYMAPNRKKITELLEADKTGQYKTYKNDLLAISKATDAATRTELIAKLERDHHAFIKNAYNKVVVNHEEQRREVARILGHNNFIFGEFADIQIEVISPTAVLPLRFDVELNCPMEVTDKSDNSILAADCVAGVSDCALGGTALSEVAGGCRSKASVGDNFELPGSGVFTSIKVTTQTDIKYEGVAMAIGGYSQSNVKFGIRFRAPGVDKVVMTKEVMALAPVVWLSRIKGEQNNYVASATFTGSFNSGTLITVQSHTETFALSLPVVSVPSFADTSTTNIDSIRIEGDN